MRRFFDKIDKKYGSETLRTALFFAFPFFLNAVLYLNTGWGSDALHSVGAGLFWRAIMTSAVLLLLYSVLSALGRRAWIPAAVMALPLYIISLADYYKQINLGTRIGVDDIAMVVNIGELWNVKGGQGSGMPFRPMFVVTGLALAAYVMLLAALRVRGPFYGAHRRAISLVTAMALLVPLSVDSFAKQLFEPQIEAYDDVSSHEQDAEPMNAVDCLIGSIYYDTVAPETTLDYNRTNVENLLAPYEGTYGTGMRPDVIVIMSESYFDLNRVNGIAIHEDIYENFSRMKAHNAGGEIVVPSFGGGTAATEFEVLSGTSNEAQNNTKSPYKHIDKDGDIWTYERYFEDMGYTTTYIHPYKRYFYEREKAFTAMGFDTLRFEDSLTVTPGEYPRDAHISDAAFVDQIIADLESSGAQPAFIFGTSMQNHSPYVKLSDDDREIVTCSALTDGELEALNAYANGIADTDRALGRLLDYIDARERPTALLFYGDHQPLLDGYKRLNGITNENIYNDLSHLSTEFAVYTNFEAAKQEQGLMAEKFSSFYLMNVFLDYIGMGKTPYMEFLSECMQALPVHSVKEEITGKNSLQTARFREALRILSYDRLLGEKYSYS